MDEGKPGEILLLFEGQIWFWTNMGFGQIWVLDKYGFWTNMDFEQIWVLDKYRF